MVMVTILLTYIHWCIVNLILYTPQIGLALGFIYYAQQRTKDFFDFTSDWYNAITTTISLDLDVIGYKKEDLELKGKDKELFRVNTLINATREIFSDVIHKKPRCRVKLERFELLAFHVENVVFDKLMLLEKYKENLISCNDNIESLKETFDHELRKINVSKELDSFRKEYRKTAHYYSWHLLFLRNLLKKMIYKIYEFI